MQLRTEENQISFNSGMLIILEDIYDFQFSIDYFYLLGSPAVQHFLIFNTSKEGEYSNCKVRFVPLYLSSICVTHIC